MGAEATPKWLEGGANLRKLRQAKPLTLDGLAEIVGTSRQHLIRLEKGQHRPEPPMLDRIAAALGVSREDIDEGQREQQEASDDDEEGDLLAAIYVDSRGFLRLKRAAA